MSRLLGMIFLLIGVVCVGAVVQTHAVEPGIFAPLFLGMGGYLTFHKGTLQ